MLLALLFRCLILAPLAYATDRAESPWRQRVKSCLDTLFQHGTDHYGPERTPLLMAVVDVNSHQSPKNPR